MATTLKELQERLSERFDPDILIEILGISSVEIVEAFPDHVEENFDRLVKEVFEDDDNSGE